MTRYYHNENPQVLHWMGKCATLQQELDCVNETLEDCQQLLDLNRSISGMRFEELKNYEERIEEFNSLPWYKKMFYKFEI